jgi:hypothetical protein
VDCLFAAQCGDTQPPAAPVSLVVTTQKRRADLDWADSPEPDLAGYRVYRAGAPGGPWTQLTTALLPASAYSDLGILDGSLWFYVVRAADTSGNLSAASNLDLTRWSRVPAPAPASLQGTSAWINELHYDNAGSDVGEFVEVAGTAGLDLSGWTLVGYNGSGGGVYFSLPLGGPVPGQQGGYGTRAFATPGLQNGAPDGIALVDAQGQVLEFLTYEGTFVAADGPAQGMLAAAIPTSEGDSTPAGFSLQRQGAGHGGASFAWSAPIAATLGQVNAGQTLQ